MFPRFLVIGGQKCGTSWLQDNLSGHHQIWLPPTKEVHYLDKGNDPLLKRLFGTSKRMRKARAHVSQEFGKWLSGEGTSGLGWALNYWLAPRNDRWYGSLFPDIAGKIPGEICPGYALMRGDEVARAARLMPDVKVIYLLRNPVERGWSYAAQYFSSPRRKGRHGSATNVPEAVLKDFLAEDARGHSDYISALEAWQAYIPADRMMVRYFDELEENPRALFTQILDFLAIDSSAAAIPAGIGENRRASRGSKAPDQYRTYLAQLHLPQLEALDARLGSTWTNIWLDEARELVSRA